MGGPGPIPSTLSTNSPESRQLYHTIPVADPGFPIGGTPTSWGGGTPTPDTATFRKICMSKRKNWDLWGARRVHPLDPPMHPVATVQPKRPNIT